jgi:hypothetical protein
MYGSAECNGEITGLRKSEHKISSFDMCIQVLSACSEMF